MRWHIFSFAFATVLLWAVAGLGGAPAADNGDYRTAGGLSVYLGVLPAAMIRGHPITHSEAGMHSGVPRGRHVYHIIAALFDAESGDRIEDATVEARVIPLGLAGVKRRLEPMSIAGTVTYGNYFTLGGGGAFRIRLSITPKGQHQPVMMEFTHEHPTR